MEHPPGHLSGRLLAWFDANRRELPWRRDRDPYRVWVSEVMLQQTVAAAAAPFFERFIERFPTVRDLAAADEADVLKEWSGLGYYRRAKNLHAAAKIIIDEHGGEMPTGADSWDRLPGVGRYILGAVMSQAFGARLPVVEANSLRVLCRLHGMADDPRTAAGQKWLWSVAASLLPPERVGDYNQAIMELGALVCRPKSPPCGECPWAADCVARRDGTQESIPVRPARQKVTEVDEVAVVISRDTEFLLVKRGEAGRWAGMWEFPHMEVAAGESHTDAAARLAASLGVEARVGESLLTVRHGVTRYRITMTCLKAEFTAGEFRPGESYVDAAWVAPASLSAYPVGTPQRKLIDELTRSSRQPRLF